MTTAVADELSAGLSARLRGFRQVQRLAYECAEAVAAQLHPGVTERAAARTQREWLRERGVRDWFHPPFARSGDRTAFVNCRIPLQFFPTDRRPEPGMAYPFGVIAHKVDRAGQRRWSPRGTGARFEELLVVTDSQDPEQSAFRPDDDPPWGFPRARSFEHGGVRRWTEGTK